MEIVLALVGVAGLVGLIDLISDDDTPAQQDADAPPPEEDEPTIPEEPVEQVVRADGTVTGTSLDDEILLTDEDYAGAYGGAGDDSIHSQNFIPTSVYGGEGDDVISGRYESSHLYGEEGNDTISANMTQTTTWNYVYGGEGDDTIQIDGTASNDPYSYAARVEGNEGADTFEVTFDVDTHDSYGEQVLDEAGPPVENGTDTVALIYDFDPAEDTLVVIPQESDGYSYQEHRVEDASVFITMANEDGDEWEAVIGTGSSTPLTMDDVQIQLATS